MKGYIEIEKHNEVVNEFAAYKLETDQQLAAFKFQLQELQRLIHGAKSERYIPDLPAEQLSLFEQEYKAIEEQYTEQVAAHERKKPIKKKSIRFEIPTHLRVEEEVLLPDVDTSNMVRIGAEYTTTLAYTPAELFVKKLTRPKFVERPVKVNKETTEQTTRLSDTSSTTTIQEPSGVDERRQFLQQGPVYIAAMPSRFIDKCKADVSLLCAIIADKYVDHLPLYRTQERLRRSSGVTIPLSTMCGWVGRSATNMEVLYNKLIEIVLASTYLQLDETRMEVLPQKTEGLEEKEKGNIKVKAPPKPRLRNRRNKKGKNKKRKTHRGFLYGYLAMPEQLLFFEYDKTRTAANPLRRLKDYSGTLQTDCYDIYDQVRDVYGEAIIHYHCLNHARRNFEKALNNDAQRADHVLGQFQRLYAIEEVARKEKWSTEKIYQVRQEKAKPILTDLFDWMEEEYQKVLPQSVIGKAMAYMLPRKERMMHYLSDGNLHIDNNPIENAIRPIAVGRKNYLFAGSHQAAQWTAIFYSFFACCRLHEIDPAQWLEDVMRRLPEHPVNQIEQLLPHLWKKEQQQKKEPQ